MNHSDLIDKWNQLLAWLWQNGLELSIAAAVAIGLVLGLVGLRMLICRLLGGPESTGWRHVAEHVIARTKALFIVIAVIKLASIPLALSPRLDALLSTLFVIAIAFQSAIWVRALIIGWIEQRVGAGEEHRTLGTAIGLIRVLVSVATFLIATIVVLDNLGVNVTGLVAGLGIGGIAIGLAAQGIFSDLFAALAIIFDRPFRRGDTINVGGGPGGQTGTVENIGLKTTRIRALDGELVAYGNAELLKMRLHNFALMDHRRVVMHFGVTYETKPELLDAIPKEVQAIIEAQEHASFDRSHLIGFGASSLDYETIYIIDSPQFPVFAHARHEIMLAIIKRFAELGIAFAYPTQTTYTAAPDGTLVMPWPPGLAGD